SPANAQMDKPWIAVTPQDAILVSYTVFDNGQSGTVLVARSANGGATWTTAAAAQGPGFRNLGYLCPPRRTGTRTYLVNMGEQDGIALHWSDDDGLSWPAANLNAIAPSPMNTQGI